MAHKDKCAHPACNCAASTDSDYCSAYCEDAEDTTEIACGCGHAGCADTMATREA
jgi:hypothetical protein